MDHGPTPSGIPDDSGGNPDEANFLRHVAGGYDAVLGQLCSRCGAVLDAGRDSERNYEIAAKPPGGFRPGEGVLVSAGGAFLAAESVLKADRDRSDEADCESVL